ncbi:MAG: D-sedoheptulose 7-phosphate isomerase [Calditrichaeota bacterium]|nr:D-sedoheptulose 7-phosphate isomerase [Calditrichota bacterium]
MIRDRYSETILKTVDLMISCYKNSGKLLICGNGGSAADSQHFAAEMVGRLVKDRDPLPAIALTTDTSILTAIGNDYSYDVVFRKQVQALGKSGDVLVCMSTSGNSENVAQAILGAKEKNIQTVALLGKSGGKIAGMADHVIVVPSNVSQRIQEGHITIIHIWCEIIESTLFPDA